MPDSFWQWVVFILNEYGGLFLTGLKNTMMIAVLSTVFGFLIGLLVASLRSIKVSQHEGAVKRICAKLLDILLAVYVEVFRGTPMIVQAMVIYYGLFRNVDIGKMTAAVFIVSINTGSYMAEIIRGGILSVDKSQEEGAYSIGMTHSQALRYVILPQAIRNVMPSIGNEFVVNIKDSSVLSVISVFELFFAGKSASGTYLRYFEVNFIIAVIYLIVTYTVTRGMRLIEKRLEGPGVVTITGSQSDSRSVITVRED